MVDEMGGYVAHTEEMKNAYIIVQKSIENRPFGRPNHRWQNNIKVGINEIC
jgi:hypothetical protein